MQIFFREFFTLFQFYTRLVKRKPVKKHFFLFIMILRKYEMTAETLLQPLKIVFL